MGNAIREIVAVAVVLAIVGVGALWRQSRATSCPKHNHWAGRIGLTLAWLSLIVGVFLLAYAAVLQWSNSESARAPLETPDEGDAPGPRGLGGGLVNATSADFQGRGLACVASLSVVPQLRR